MLIFWHFVAAVTLISTFLMSIELALTWPSASRHDRKVSLAICKAELALFLIFAFKAGWWKV